jgi:hypothetical protein
MNRKHRPTMGFATSFISTSRQRGRWLGCGRAGIVFRSDACRTLGCATAVDADTRHRRRACGTGRC